jgi:hypothetical protein
MGIFPMITRAQDAEVAANARQCKEKMTLREIAGGTS